MIHFITDRTQADVDRVQLLSAKGFANMTAEERAEWLAGMRGAYNSTDLNRVESAVQYLAEILNVSVTTKTNWAVTDIPSTADMERYLENIRKLRAKNKILATTPETPSSMTRLTYSTANNIEKILADIESFTSMWGRSGEVFCGEV
ncbi:MAG: hypothetical protein IKY90_00005 [Oscillospiraceae bacterium]|nr:hypothetical protein [Oscillospiraceae bacterium]